MKTQPITHHEASLVAELQPTDWSDIVPFFSFYTSAPHCFPVKVLIDDKIRGIGSLIIHDEVAWLGHIIVHPAHRKKGIGQLITEALVKDAHAKKCDTIFLIATELGAPVYEKSGFITETEYLFFKNITSEGGEAISRNILPFTEKFKEQIATLDSQSSSENRMSLMKSHLDDGYVFVRDELVEGFYLPSFGEGLILANTSDAGLALTTLRTTTKDTAAFPVDNVIATEYFRQRGYQEFRKAKRMRLGKERSWHPENLYNRIGGNIG